MSEIDKSQFKPTYTAEDLAAIAQSGVKFKNDAWYKFRCVSGASGVSKAKDFIDDKGEVHTPKGRQLIYINWQALRPDGNLSTKTPEVKQNLTLFARPNPELLKAYNYTDEQIAAAVQNGALDPFVYKTMKEMLAAHNPDEFRSKKDESGKWNMTIDQQRDKILAAQFDYWVKPEMFKGYEFYFKVRLKQSGNFTNVELNWPRHKDDPPREADGTLSVIVDPDAKL